MYVATLLAHALLRYIGLPGHVRDKRSHPKMLPKQYCLRVVAISCVAASLSNTCTWLRITVTLVQQHEPIRCN